jgi:hypothetical protein
MAGRHVHTDGAAVALGFVCAMPDRAGAREIVTLHDTGEAAALARRGDIDELTVLEYVGSP